MPKSAATSGLKERIMAHIAQGVEMRKQQVIRMLMYVGEQCVNDARLKGSYMDHTRNLRGSTGYVVVDSGKIVSLDAPNNGSPEGSAKATSLMNELAMGYTSGLVLIIVAGMHYAAYVADRGYNVLDSAESLAEKLIGDLQKTML